MQQQQATLTSAHGLSRTESLAEFEFEFWKSSNPEEIKYLKDQVDLRVGKSALPEMVTKVSLITYFSLINSAYNDLIGHFSDNELLILLDAQPQPWLGTESPTSLASRISDNYGADCVEDLSAPVLDLCHKLYALTPLQRVALLDLMERAWRDREIGPLAYIKRELHHWDGRREFST